MKELVRSATLLGVQLNACAQVMDCLLHPPSSHIRRHVLRVQVLELREPIRDTGLNLSKELVHPRRVHLLDVLGTIQIPARPVRLRLTQVHGESGPQPVSFSQRLFALVTAAPSHQPTPSARIGAPCLLLRNC